MDPFEEFFVQKRKTLDDSDDSEEVKAGCRNTMEDYLINYSVVPSHFPVSLVEKILFIGNSVGILKNSDSMNHRAKCFVFIYEGYKFVFTIHRN